METSNPTAPPEQCCRTCGEPLSLLELREMQCEGCEADELERRRRDDIEDAARELAEDREFWGTR